jgi:nucleoside-diphosphate-sugar epimerase
MTKKYLVTGGLGFLGASLTRGLLQKGHTVRVLDNSSRGSKEKLGDMAGHAEIMEGDIRDPLIVKKAVKGMDSVCHLAFVNGTEFFYKYPAYVLDVGVKGMINVLDASIEAGVKELIVASSSEVYQTPPVVPTPESVPLSVPDPLNPRYSYGGGKILSELMALNYGREYFERVLLFRPHNVYGPAMGFEHVIPQFAMRLKELQKDASKGKPVRFEIQGSGQQTRSFIYIDDFTEGLLLVLEKGKHLGIYHIGTMDEVSIQTLAEMVAEEMGLQIELIPGKDAEGGTLRRCPDIATLKSLGFSPKVSLQKGLEPTVAWYNAHTKPPARIEKPALFIP